MEPYEALSDSVPDEALAAYALLRRLGGLHPRPQAVAERAAHLAASLAASPALRTRLRRIERRLSAIHADAVVGFERLTGHRLADLHAGRLRRRC